MRQQQKNQFVLREGQSETPLPPVFIVDVGLITSGLPDGLFSNQKSQVG
jgi:hypothetical protein